MDANTTSYSDVASIPIVKSERYAVSCGLTYGKTLMSPAHQPMHLMVNRGAGTGWNLSWNKYEGRNVISYRILRGDSPSSLKKDAGTLIPAAYVSISSVDGSFDVDGKEKTGLQLIATVYPVNATMRGGGIGWFLRARTLSA